MNPSIIETASSSFAVARVADLPVVRQHGLREHLVLPIDRERAVLDRGRQEVQQIARVHLARVPRELRRQIARPEDLHAVRRHDRFAGHRQLAVAAAFRGEIDDDGAGSPSPRRRSSR